MASQSAIYEATLVCRQAFRDAAAMPSLQEWAENCLADLNLWANGAGALKVGKASLDARLSSNPDAKMTKNDFITENDRDGDRLYQAMQDARSIIGQLSRITSSIRKAGINARIQKADASYDPRHPQIEALNKHLQLLLLSKPTQCGTLRAETLPHGVLLVSSRDDTIVGDSRSLTVIQQRLIEANLKRRHRFLYAQRHAIKLSDSDPAPTASIPIPREISLAPALNPFAGSTEELERPKVYSTTTATDVQDPIPLPMRPSVQQTTTVISAISSRVRYPKPPPLRPDQNVFQCPSCCQALPASMSRGSQWKKHLSKDILPYTCILEDCPSPESLYHGRDLWLSHMFTDHGGIPHWVCLACNDSTERPVFYEESGLTDHLDRKHSRGIKPQQIPILASAWRRKRPVTIRSCPLCGLTDPDPNAVLNHVAEHLHSFSLRSLPWVPEESESNVDIYGAYFDDHPYFDAGRSVDTGSVGSRSTESSEQMGLEGQPAMESDNGPTENNQLTEENIHRFSEDSRVDQDIMGAFLAGIEHQPPEKTPILFQRQPSQVDIGEEVIVIEESESEGHDDDDDESSAAPPPLPAPSDSEFFSTDEDEKQGSLSDQPASSSAVIPPSGFTDDSAPVTFQSPSVAQEDILSPSLSQYVDTGAIPPALLEKAEAAITAGAEAAGFLLDSGMLSRHITPPQGNPGASESPSNLIVFYDEDKFEYSLDELYEKCFQCVARLVEFLDNVPCRSLGELELEYTAYRFRNAILDGSDVDILLADPLHRRNIFMAVTMTMVWEWVFTRYLFGLERQIHLGIKLLEKELRQTLPQEAVNRWLATTLSLLAQDPEVKQQQTFDIQAVSKTIAEVLMSVISEETPGMLELLTDLNEVLRDAVQLSVEMHTQLANYLMLPPLRPEYDNNANLASKIFFNSSLMQDVSGMYASDEEAESEHAVVRTVLFPLVVKKGDDQGRGEEEVVIYPAQVVVAKRQGESSAAES
ncbi:hypothetical protein AbraIFM66950_005105 [Aspergillus brasiliensis]|nr:hypothetical protein AbraIFM66950_005105 [Aspergillus brasiliensis]